MRLWLALAYGLVGGAAALPVSAQSGPATPLQAELVRTLDARTLKTGDEVLLTVLREWKDGGCPVPAGAAVRASVTAVEPGPHVRRERVALRISHPCEASGSQQMFWMALLQPETAIIKGVNDDPQRLRSMHSASFGQGGGFGSAGNTQANHVDLSGRQNPSLPAFPPEDPEEIKRPQNVKTGQVWGLPRLALQVGEGPGGSTFVASTSGRLLLPARSVLVLLDERGALKPSAAPLRPANPAGPRRTFAREEVAPALPCRAPHCAEARFESAAEPLGEPGLKVPFRTLGLRPASAAEVSGLEYGAALAFLGEQQVLVTFNSGALVNRNPADRPEDHARMVRAEVIDRSTGKLTQAVDWRVPDTRRYLWQLPGGRVLAHVDASLQWLGADLRQERTLPLDGTLAFVHVSPDGRHVAVGVVDELHTAAEHSKLVDGSAGAPEERIHIRIYDESLALVDEVRESSARMAPVLLSDGTVEVRHLEKDQFFLQEQRWGRTTHRNFARVTSSCVPKLEAFSRDLLLLETCQAGQLDNTFRVLDSQGAPVVAGSLQWRQFSPLVEGDAAQRWFALTIVEGGASYFRDRLFRPSDLARETVGIFDASDGQLIASLRMKTPGVESQPVALSPRGDAFAVLNGKELEIYPLQHSVGSSGEASGLVDDSHR